MSRARCSQAEGPNLLNVLLGGSPPRSRTATCLMTRPCETPKDGCGAARPAVPRWHLCTRSTGWHVSESLICATAVAALLGISSRTVYDLVYSGRLTVYLVGGSLRFDPADVEAFKQSCRRQARPATALGPRRRPPSVRISREDSDSALRRYFESNGVKPRLRPPGIGKR